MKQYPSIERQTPAAGTLATPWLRFWFSAVDPVGLHALRILTGVLLLLWLLPFAGNQDALFSLAGWIDREALQQAAELENGPPAPLGWSILYLAGENPQLVDLIYWASVGAILLFTFGLAVRITAVLTWVVVVSFLANPATSYDADYLLVIPAFYLMLGYVLYGQFRRSASIADRILGPRDAWVTRLFSQSRDETPSHAANFAVRLFQVHFAIVVLVSALHKLQMADWWSGVAFFYPLHAPYQTTVQDIRNVSRVAESYFFALSLAQYAVLAWQLSFPFFAWRGGWCRWLLVGGAAVGWLGSAFLFKQPLFGPIYFIGCLNYLTPREWGGLGGWLRGFIPGFATSAAEPPKSLRHMNRVAATRSA